CLLLYGSAVLF
nr:immunoglobulin light chain junction region [Macaca mulatta]